MSTPDRAEQVAGYVAELRPHVSHALGLTVLSAQARDELAAFIVLMQTEIAGRSRNISALLEAYYHVLSAGGRADATTDPPAALGILGSDQQVDLRDAAELLGVKEDTLRKRLREKRIEGAVVNGRWRIPVSAIDNELSRKETA